MSLGQFLEGEEESLALLRGSGNEKNERDTFFRSREFLRLTAIRSVRRRSEAEEAGGCDRSSSSSVRINPRVERESARICTEPGKQWISRVEYIFLKKAPFTCNSSRSLMVSQGQCFKRKNYLSSFGKSLHGMSARRSLRLPPPPSSFRPTEKPGHRGKGKGKEADAKSEGEGEKRKGKKSSLDRR